MKVSCITLSFRLQIESLSYRKEIYRLLVFKNLNHLSNEYINYRGNGFHWHMLVKSIGRSSQYTYLMPPNLVFDTSEKVNVI